MSRRPTITDVARAAGVSVATVDRVLNGRALVREETARKVQAAAEAVGYHGVALIRSRIADERPTLRLGLVLQKERHAFYQDFQREMAAAAGALQSHRVTLETRFARSIRPEELAEILLSFRGRADAVAATGMDHPEVTAAVQALRDAGIPCFSLLSDFAQGVRESYLGTNNLKAGRSAGWLMARLAPGPGKVAVFIGASRYHGHELRETGLRSYLREAGGFELLETRVNLETRDLTYEATTDLLHRNPGLVGLYVAGGGMEGAVRAFEETGAGRRAVLIVHELTPESQRGLQQGAVSIVLATPLRQIAAEILDLAAATSRTGMAAMPGQRFFQPMIYTPESLS